MARRRAEPGQAVDHRGRRDLHEVLLPAQDLPADLADAGDLRRADDGVGFGKFLPQFILVALREAAGNHEGAAFPLLLHLRGLEDGPDGLLLGGLDESAGVHHDDLGFLPVRGQLEPRAGEHAHHLLGIHLVLGAAQAHHAYLVRFFRHALVPAALENREEDREEGPPRPQPFQK